MALSPEEQKIVEFGKANGKTPNEVKAAVAKFRQEQLVKTGAAATPAAVPTAQPEAPTNQEGLLTRGARAVTNFLGLDKATDVFGRAIARTNLGAKLTGTDVNANREFIEAPTKTQLAGATLQTAATAAGAALPTPATLLGKVALGGAAGYAYDIGQDMAEGKSLGETLTPGMAAVVGSVVPGAGPAAKGTASAVKKGVQIASDSPVVRGAIQTGAEFVERAPRFLSKKAVQIKDAATRAERIASSPAPVGNALKSGMDERIVNTIEQADAPTLDKYKEIVRLAEESVSTTGTLKMPARPEIVAGEAAAEQYKLIDTQRRRIGAQIGDAVKSLSKTEEIPMDVPRQQLQDILGEIGVGVIEKNEKTVLDFSKTGFTNAQRTKINELYKLATEGGETLTPAQIHAKDRLFSQLQRETRMDGIGDIVVDSADGQLSLFRIFRDVYSDTLEEIAPDIKPLNRQYRNLSTFVDDIENSIVKSGKFETNSRLDPAEFAQTNLRRLFSEAQSAADYRAIVEEMDAASRALGYEGANPADLAQFAYEIRKIYPEATPRTGFEGGIRASVSGVVDSVLQAGKADVTDQQKALRELLNSLSPQQ